MTGWIRTHPYTILAAVILAAIIGWLTVTHKPWTYWASAAIYAGVCAWSGIVRGRRAHRCPPECRISVQHRHERIR